MIERRAWHRIYRGWWWYDARPGHHLGDTETGYHADVFLTIWPLWRFTVCRWVGCRPTHNVVRGYRLTLARTQRATEQAIANLVGPHDA